jgi:hypothetical protein
MPYADSYSVAYANSDSNCHGHSNCHGYAYGYGDSYSYCDVYSHANAYCAAADDTEATTITGSQADAVTEALSKVNALGPPMSGEHTRLACWFRRRAGTIFANALQLRLSDPQ